MKQNINQSTPKHSKTKSIILTIITQESLKEEDWEKLTPEIRFLFNEYLRSGLTFKDFLSITANVLGEDGCGDDPELKGYVEEHMHFEKPFFLYSTITNISSNNIQLNELLLTEHFTREIISEKLPPYRLKPNHSIIIPLGQFLEHSIENNDIEGEYTSEMTYFIYKNKANINAKYFGASTFLQKVIFESDNRSIEIEPHDFNSNTILYIDNEWGMGSCPHLFLSRNEFYYEYLRELIPNGQRKMAIDSLIIDRNVKELIIVELEDEVTYFREIKRNGEPVFRNVSLSKGDHLTINDLKPGDELLFCGLYQPIGQIRNNAESRKQRNSLIVNWLNTKNTIKKATI